MRKITCSFVALLALFFLVSSCKKKDDDTSTATETIKVGALLSLTGNWSSLGITSKAAIDIAVEDINAKMTKDGSKYRFTSIVYDTKLEAPLASQYITQAGKEGCQFVVGPQSSAEASIIIDHAQLGNIIAVSQGSTAGSLSYEGDNLFRFCPADNIEGLAMAKTIYKDGIRALVTVARDDAGNKGLQLSTGNAFTALTGKVSATTPYSNAATVDFTPLLADIKAKITQYKTTNTTPEIAVYLASFDECVELFKQAATDPMLSSVRWYGGDGTALSAALTANAAACDFMIATKYFAPSFGLPAAASATWQPVADKIKGRTGVAPDAFALAAYDAMWVIANTYNAAYPQGSPAFAKLKTEFPLQAGKHTGTTGSTALNAAGDRSVGSYDYWGIAKDGSNYKWVLVGKSE